MSRPTKLDPQTTERLLEAFKLGQTSITMACAYAGIGERTYYTWMEKGDTGEEPYAQFRQDIEKARADAVMTNLVVIRKAAAEGTWQAAAWWLERSMPQQYGRKAIDIQHSGRIDVTINGVNVDDLT